jgi:hypothetical protein
MNKEGGAVCECCGIAVDDDGGGGRFRERRASWGHLMLSESSLTSVRSARVPAGGIFDFRIGSDMRLIDVVICRQRMLDYAKEYGDLIICDGTHGCEVYGMIVIFNTLIDALGKTIPCSYSQFRSENSDHIIRAFRLVGLDQPGSTLLTDKALRSQMSLPSWDCSMFYASNILRRSS